MLLLWIWLSLMLPHFFKEINNVSVWQWLCQHLPWFELLQFIRPWSYMQAKPITPLHLGFFHNYHDVFVQDKIKIKYEFHVLILVIMIWNQHGMGKFKRRKKKLQYFNNQLTFMCYVGQAGALVLMGFGHIVILFMNIFSISLSWVTFFFF